MSLLQVPELRESIPIPEWNEDHSMMDKCGHHSEGCHLLSSAWAGSGNEYGGILAMKLALNP